MLMQVVEAEFQFQRYGAPFMDSTQYDFKYNSRPNLGLRTLNTTENLLRQEPVTTPIMNITVDLDYILDAYGNTQR